MAIHHNLFRYFGLDQSGRLTEPHGYCGQNVTTGAVKFALHWCGQIFGCAGRKEKLERNPHYITG